MTASRRKLREISEKQLTASVIELCGYHPRIRVAHFRPAQLENGRWVTPVQGDGAGFPDLVIAGPGGVLWRELKTESGRLSTEQRDWISVLDAGDQDIGLWRPGCLETGRVAKEIASIAGRFRHG